MDKALWWLLGGSRGGKNRIRIIRTLDEHPMNANQLSETLDLDYKTSTITWTNSKRTMS